MPNQIVYLFQKWKTIENGTFQNKIQNHGQYILNETCELSDNESLKIIKKRLIALNSLDTVNDLKNINEVSAKFNINQDVILEDYFGFKINDLPKIEEDELKLSLENKLKVILSNFKAKQEFLIPNSLVGIKNCVPFIFVNKLSLYCIGNNNSNSNDEETLIKNLISNYMNVFRSLKEETDNCFNLYKLNRLLLKA